MMNYRGVQGGTPICTVSICRTCRSAQVLKGMADSSEAIYCRGWSRPFRVPLMVAECNVYDDKRVPSRWDMEQVAWVLMTDPHSRKAIGFVSPQEFQKRQQQAGFGPPVPSTVGQ